MSIAAFPRFEGFNLGKGRGRHKIGKHALRANEVQLNNEQPVILTPHELEEQFVSVLQAEIQLKNADDSHETDALKNFMETVGAVDVLVGSYAEHVAEQGISTFDAKGNNGTIPDARTGEPSIWSPNNINELRDAVRLYEHTRTENSQALVEALLHRYSDAKWWPGIANYRKQYVALQENLNESSESKFPSIS